MARESPQAKGGIMGQKDVGNANGPYALPETPLGYRPLGFGLGFRVQLAGTLQVEGAVGVVHIVVQP